MERKKTQRVFLACPLLVLYGIRVTIIEPITNKSRASKDLDQREWRTLIQVNQAGLDGITALSEACLYGHVEIVKLLLDCPDVDINLVDCFDGTALQSAIMSGQTEIIKMILERPDLQIDKESFPVYFKNLPPVCLPALIQHLLR